MRILLFCASASLLALTTATQPFANEDACSFKVSESTGKPAVTGPQEIVAMTYVVEQPDSPLEILALDFEDSYVAVANERFTEQLRCTAKVRNRSDQPIRGFDLSIYVTRTIGFAGSGIRAPGGKNDLAPGEDLEIQACGGNGDGGAPGNRVRLVVFVNAIAMDGCAYMPSRRYPRAWLGGS
jgi:hypothetical protein